MVTTHTLATTLVGAIGISITAPTITTIGVAILLAVHGVREALGVTALRATVVHAIATTTAIPIPAEDHTIAPCHHLLLHQEAVLVQVGVADPLLQAVLEPTTDPLPQAARAALVALADLGTPALVLLDQVRLPVVLSQVLAQEEDNICLVTHS